MTHNKVFVAVALVLALAAPAVWADDFFSIDLSGLVAFFDLDAGTIIDPNGFVVCLDQGLACDPNGNDSGTSLDPSGLRSAAQREGSGIDPHGGPARGFSIDPNGASSDLDRGAGIDPNG